MPKFPHLKFAGNLVGKARFGSGGTEAAQTKENKRRRKTHSKNLLQNTSKLNQDWDNHFADRDALGLAPLNEDIEPHLFTNKPFIIKPSCI